MKINRLSKYYYLKFIRLKGDPKSLAAGTAIGVFVGLTPTIPLHTVALIALTVITRTSFIAAMTTSCPCLQPSDLCTYLLFFPCYRQCSHPLRTQLGKNQGGPESAPFPSGSWPIVAGLGQSGHGGHHRDGCRRLYPGPAVHPSQLLSLPCHSL